MGVEEVTLRLEIETVERGVSRRDRDNPSLLRTQQLLREVGFHW